MVGRRWCQPRRVRRPGATRSDPAIDSRFCMHAVAVHVGTGCAATLADVLGARSEEHTSELQSLMRISYAVFCLKKKKNQTYVHQLTIATEINISPLNYSHYSIDHNKSCDTQEYRLTILM